MFIFYYSGHGLRDESGFKFCTKGPYLSHQKTLDAVKQLGVDKVIYLIDACHAGQFDAAKHGGRAGKAKISKAYDDGDIQAFFQGGVSGNLVMAAASAHEVAPGSSAFSHMFVKACQLIVQKEKIWKTQDPEAHTKMCVRPLAAFGLMSDLLQKKYPDAPRPRIPDIHNMASFPIGPLEEV